MVREETVCISFYRTSMSSRIRLADSHRPINCTEITELMSIFVQLIEMGTI